ncbi:hypothetical protein [Oceanobacillus sp. J11TS1]|uniref:hypothetical protein n=1 Tax=Oceanobacillus sp. J11TS1 TaxID=2807191 RepID=UPI001B1732B2|nr:hypothetical protein [Oceanobacillus sp. J11TS1]GIO22484.1 hypothetical protein J11TS1_10650 [Oceanobacillus sp. J11TS1]
MNEKLKKRFPEWCFDNKKYATVLSNDIDSLVGNMIEKKINGNEINYFYDFNNQYVMDKDNHLERLAIDLATTSGKCWDNHVTRLKKNNKVNPESANINSILAISGDNYYTKYSMSSAIKMWSFYNLPLPSTKVGKMTLLAIDVGFKGHYDSRFKEVHNKYLKLLGFDELIVLLNETKKQDYYDLIKKYKLYEHIELDENGKLRTELPLSELSEVLELDLKLPSQPFTLQTEYKSIGRYIKGDEKGSLNKKVISFALTSRSLYKFTMEK